MLRWAGLFSLAAVFAAPQEGLAGGKPQTSGNGAATANSAAPDSPSAPGNTNPASAADAQAAVPRLIKLIGIPQSMAGKPLAGPVDVTFSLYADEAGGAGTFAGHQLVDFPLLGDANVYQNTQTVDTGDLNVNTGKVAISAGDLLMGTGKIGVGTASSRKARRSDTTEVAQAGF